VIRTQQPTPGAIKLEPIVKERQEKQKEEMLGIHLSVPCLYSHMVTGVFPGKLKDLGNTILGKFGLSLDAFKATKDPTTGSYSISMQQKQ
jgi:hypothetical protein